MENNKYNSKIHPIFSLTAYILGAIIGTILSNLVCHKLHPCFCRLHEHCDRINRRQKGIKYLKENYTPIMIISGKKKYGKTIILAHKSCK